MPAFTSGVIKTIDNVQKVTEALAIFAAHDVLVGVLRSKNARVGSPIGNAEIARIHEFGSPAHNIPARPFLYPGIRKAKKEIAAKFKEGGQRALRGDKNAVLRSFAAAGLAARNSVVHEITDPAPPFAPLKPATIRARLRKTQAGRRQLRTLATKAQRSGKSTGTALLDWAAQGNIRPLIDTGALRRSISYVVR